MIDKQIGDMCLIFTILQQPYFTWSCAITLKLIETMF